MVRRFSHLAPVKGEDKVGVQDRHAKRDHKEHEDCVVSVGDVRGGIAIDAHVGPQDA